MKNAVTLIAALAATPALADPGHFAESGGHSHWFAAGTVMIAALIGAVALWRTRRVKVAKTARERRA